ncbi:hypothetical protein PUNSTDRAFT_137262 [Punctularia strigosozonata HHB-11173 SS5]|uniref:uncharacterized protein n=1 Tax=Punctularia strigosozonata (strain HHB-11173) TaxID=741275 RepID=UPI0004416C8F|nr:uncharacterized protein PUNSTDRAFT_137262 [Punctularia strigosozonata HHB-11173 SS5]EIN05770.1 hypothetical protein PUNSTDRAFT_137262 [Punctularia strigosozonata HHB-11173 SS5]
MPFDDPGFRAELDKDTQALACILEGAPFLSSLDIFDKGVYLAWNPRVLDIIVDMQHLVEFATSSSKCITPLLKRMSQPLRQLHIGKPQGLRHEVQPTILPHPSNSLADISRFSRSLETLALEETYLSHLDEAGTFPRLRYLHMTYVDSTSRLPQWCSMHITFPALRYIAYHEHEWTPDIPLESTRSFILTNKYQYQGPGISLWTDMGGSIRVFGTDHIKELIIVKPLYWRPLESVQMIAPSLLCWHYVHAHWRSCKNHLAELMGEAPSLTLVMFQDLSEYQKYKYKYPGCDCKSVCKRELEELGIILRGMPIFGLTLRTHFRLSVGVSDEKQRPTGTGVSEAAVLELIRDVPCLKHINIYGRDSKRQVLESWVVDRGEGSAESRLRRISAEDGAAWREAQMSEYSAWARDEKRVELFLDPGREIGPEVTARLKQL